MQMTEVRYISHAEEIIKVYWSKFIPDGVAVMKLSERSPLIPALTTKDIPGGSTQVVNVHQIKWFNCHLAGSDEANATNIISDTDNWLNWNGHWDNPNGSEDNWEADNQSYIAL